jgi:hypothetical protein
VAQKHHRRAFAAAESVRFVALARSTSFVDFAPVTNVMKIDAPELGVEFVEHAVIAHAQFEFGSPLQALVRESL